MNLIIKAYTLSECMEAMAAHAAELESRGEKNIIFCEDRLTLIAERALLSATGGTFLSSVFTFARFLETDEHAISKQGSVMAVGEVMTRLQRENALKCFTTTTGVGNNAKCIYETLAQMSASEITPETLKKTLEEMSKEEISPEGKKKPEDMLKRKISDLALIYEGYAKFLRDNAFLDESKYLSLLPKYIEEKNELKDANVFFLCYNSFTKQARSIIRAALKTAKSVVGVFCAGKEELYTNRAVRDFMSVCEEYDKAHIQPPKELGVPLGGEAEALRRGLFEPKSRGARTETKNVEIYEAEDKTAEAEFVAVKIRRALAENPSLRYRDIAVLVPAVSAYSLVLKKALREYDIPYFIDEKRSLKKHPLGQFLLDCFRVVREGFSPIAVQSLTQNFFFGESDEYRNYLLKFANYRGGASSDIKTSEAVKQLYSLETLKSGKERLVKATENIKDKGQGCDYCNAVRKILEDFATEEKLKELEEDVKDISQKGYLAQIHRALDKVLDEAELLTKTREMTVAEFEAILKDGLDATEISLIPLKADAVFIGDITDSRIEKVNVLFAMGLTEEVPRCGTDTAIVSDKEIRRLEEVKTLLEPTVAEVNLRARESVALNLCTFLDKLYLSYPLGADGSEPSTSEIFRYIDRLFGVKKTIIKDNGERREEIVELPRQKKISDADFKYKCSADGPALRQFLVEIEEYELRKEDTRKRYTPLYYALDKLGIEEKDAYWKGYQPPEKIENGEKLFFDEGTISPTALEKFFDCPFGYFAEKGLRLKEREETAVLAMDTGDFIHKLLQNTIVKASKKKTEEEVRAYALEEGKELLKTPIFETQKDTASGEYFSDKLLQEGADVVVAAYRQIKDSEFVVEVTEKEVQIEDFKGKVDRVDSTQKYIRVIDYKTGTIEDDAAAYYTGRKMQLQLYMSAVKGERVPAGVFYFPASVQYSDDTEARFRMKGFLNGDAEALRCGDKNITEDKKSEYFPAALKNDAKAKRVMDEATFRDFLDYSVFVARQGSKEIKEGYIAPTPYEKSCEYCKYGGMCNFNKDASIVRKEKDIDTKMIAEIARKKREGE